MWYDVARDLLDQIDRCFGTCDYITHVSRSRPPADCDTIAAWMDLSQSITQNSPVAGVTGTTIYKETLGFTLTRCCVRDPSMALDQLLLLEQADAQCFYRDVQIMRDCLACCAPAILRANYNVDCHGDAASMVQFEGESGGCAQATVFVSWKQAVCCAPACP